MGTFDEGYFMYAEETDLCRRLADAGWERWYVPSVTVVHHHQASSAAVPDRRVAERAEPAALWEQHAGRLDAAVARGAIAAQMAAMEAAVRVSGAAASRSTRSACTAAARSGGRSGRACASSPRSSTRGARRSAAAAGARAAPPTALATRIADGLVLAALLCATWLKLAFAVLADLPLDDLLMLAAIGWIVGERASRRDGRVARQAVALGGLALVVLAVYLAGFQAVSSGLGVEPVLEVALDVGPPHGLRGRLRGALAARGPALYARAALVPRRLPRQRRLRRRPARARARRHEPGQAPGSRRSSAARRPAAQR